MISLCCKILSHLHGPSIFNCKRLGFNILGQIIAKWLNMDILVFISGFIVVLYAGYSGLGLWLAQHVTSIEKGEEPLIDENGLSIMDHMPKTHIDLIKHYYLGARGMVWRISFLCLIGAVVALILQSKVGVYLFGVGLAVDCALFLTYDGRRAFLADAEKAELQFDAIQYLALLMAFMILFIQNIKP